jgi:hypothetical protein
MTLQARLLKLERRARSDPFDSLSDEELNAALQAVTWKIEAQTGMPIADYHDHLARQLADEELPEELDASFIRQYLASDNALVAARMALGHR